jgi:hypothetical protein
MWGIQGGTVTKIGSKVSGRTKGKADKSPHSPQGEDNPRTVDDDANYAKMN